MKRVLCVMCLVALSSACLDEQMNSKSGELTKEEARQQQTADSRDLCEAFDWYGDGVCDDFCANTDPDCAAQCAAYPSCSPDQFQVDECDTTQSGCTTASMCGSTIFCQEEGIGQCQAYPSCGPDATEVEECPTDSFCEEASICGYTILCATPLACPMIALCPEGSIEVEDCEANDPHCEEISTCGGTISCREALVNCTAYPSCPEGHAEVEACTVDAECLTATLCGTTIICQPGAI